MISNKHLLVVIAIIGILSISLAQQTITNDVEGTCLTFEKIENRILEDGSILVFLRNCGKETLRNITIILTYGEEVQIRTISSISPNEIKYIRFNVFLGIGERKLATVYAYSEIVSIKYDFYIERPTYLHAIKLAVNTDRLTRNELNEVFISIKNSEIRSFKDLEFSVESPSGVTTSYDVTRFTLYPLQTKVVKLRVFVSEDYKEKTVTLRIKVGEREFTKDFAIKDRIEIDWLKVLERFVFIVIALVALFVVFRIVEKKFLKTEVKIER